MHRLGGERANLTMRTRRKLRAQESPLPSGSQGVRRLRPRPSESKIYYCLDIGPQVFSRMPSVHDVAKFILQECGEISVMKLQKLLYYCQAWHLVWEEKPLFPERIEAWANGPVVPAAYSIHRGKFSLSSWPKGHAVSLTAKHQETVKKVLAFYGKHTAQWLSDLTHRERPWLDARRGLAPSERGEKIITPAAMHEYYSSL